MNRAVSSTIVVAGLVLTLGGAASWGQVPNTNDKSDATDNTGGGRNALQNNTGESNTAYGATALTNGNSGFGNTATGVAALLGNTTGTRNTASGVEALYHNSSGSYNAATGAYALTSNTTGRLNTAAGSTALQRNTAGSGNTAAGYGALGSNTTGTFNTAVGYTALSTNPKGTFNTALGYQALSNAVIGSGNLALGVNASFHLMSGASNIYLGNTGASTESNTMRLGSAQTRTFIAGIKGVPISGATVTINNAGQLGIIASSARYKRDIQDLGEQSQGVYQLRPVTFRYKQDKRGQRQYGLIAEEVAKIYPELVTKGPDGKVESVQYYEIIPMLLNEVQRQQQEIGELKAQARQVAEVKAENERLQAAVGQMQQRDEEQRAQNAALAARLERLEVGADRVATAAAR